MSPFTFGLTLQQGKDEKKIDIVAHSDRGGKRKMKMT